MRRTAGTRRHRPEIRLARDARPSGEPDRLPSRAAGVPLLRPVSARLSYGVVFQQPLGDAACGCPDRQVHAGQRRGGQPRAHRFAGPGGRRALHRPHVASASRGLRARCDPGRRRPRVHTHPAQFPLAGVFARRGQRGRRPWPLPDGPFHRRRRRRVHAGPALVRP